MYNLKIILVFIFLFSLKTSKAQFKDTLYTWGLQSSEKAHAVKLISDKWKIYRYGYGCVIYQSLEDSLIKKNEATYQRLIPKYGYGWLDRYYQEIEKESEIELAIDKLVKKQKFMIGLELANPWPGSPLPMYPIDNNGNYIVSVNNYHGKDWQEEKLFKLLVNHKRKSVKIIKNYTLGK